MLNKISNFILAISFFLYVPSQSFSFFEKNNHIAADDAHALCVLIDKSMPLSEPCKVSVKTRSVDIVIETNRGQASQFCLAITTFAKTHGAKDFNEHGWKVRIFSPYSGNRTIFQCNF